MMPKPPSYTPREQEVLDAPDGYVLKTYLGPRRGWWSKDAADIEKGDPLEVSRRFVREFHEANPAKPVLVYAYRVVAGERRMACVDTEGWT